jgi:hypothetical protein
MSPRARTALAALLALLAPLAAAAQPGAKSQHDPDDPALAALALALAAVPVPEQADPGQVKDPRVELVVTFSARSLVFDELPRLRTTLGGAGPRRAVWHVERTNLPARIEQGVEYRDVKVRVTLVSAVDEFEALLEDARRVASGIRAEDATPL